MAFNAPMKATEIPTPMIARSGNMTAKSDACENTTVAMPAMAYRVAVTRRAPKRSSSIPSGSCTPA